MPVRATVVSAPPDREPRLRSRQEPRSARRAFSRNPGRPPGFAAETSIDHRGFKPKLRRGATETPAPRRSFAPRRPPRERSCGRDGPAAYRSSTERVCPRVVPKGRADRDRNGQTPHARVACQCRHDAGWPCKRGAHRALAVRFRRSHHAPRSWPFARGGSARVSRPPGRRSSSSSQCGSTAATAPRRGRPQACRLTAVDGGVISGCGLWACDVCV